MSVNILSYSPSLNVVLESVAVKSIGSTGTVGLYANSTGASSYNLVFPTTQGGTGSFMYNDSNGNLSWSSGSNAGPNSGFYTTDSGISVQSSNTVPTFLNYTASGITLTPSSASSKFLVNFSSVASITNAANTGVAVNLARNGSAVQSNPLSLMQTSTVNQGTPINFTYVDSPNTTSAVTYSFMLACLGPGPGYSTIGWYPGGTGPAYFPQTSLAVQEIH